MNHYGVRIKFIIGTWLEERRRKKRSEEIVIYVFLYVEKD